MITRYQTQEIAKIWADETRYQTWLKVELAYLKTILPKLNQDPNLIARLEKKAGEINWTLFAKDVAHKEEKLRHDVIAFLECVEEHLGDDARFIHLGLTSSDIVDTSFAMLLKQAATAVSARLLALIQALMRKAEEFSGLVCLGRTHGRAAEPTTFGIKLLSFACELARGYQRLLVAQQEIAVGKLSGAVGVYSLVDPTSEQEALKSLGLKCETVATQVVARDRHAHYFCTLAVIAGSLERLSVAIRLLAHDGVDEVSEPFGAGQKGSSAMPHKKNPILTENVTGLMRLMRSYAMAALEDQALWHERDISHSSVERVIAPDATHAMDFALKRMTMVIEEMVVDKAKVARNVEVHGQKMRSQKILWHLINAGLARKPAYELVQKASQAAGEAAFKDSLHSLGIDKYLDEKKLGDIFTMNLAPAHEPELTRQAIDEIGRLTSANAN